jgi:PIN domain nuclease of toxin-antitoxin system
MDCLADTHASVWYLFAAPELSATAKNFMDASASSGGFVFVPTISVIEIIYLTEKGKLLPQTLPRLIQTVNPPNSSFSFIELDSDIAQT